MGRKADGSGYCGQAPGWGTEHVGIGRCKRHGGSAPLYAQKVEKLRAAVAVEQYGLPRHVDPHTALEEELDRSAGHVDWLRMQVAALETEAMHGPVGGGQGAIPEHKPHIWISMYNEERDRFRRIAKTCIDAGIAQRRVELAEAQGQLVAVAIRAILERLGVLQHPEAPQIVREELLRLSTDSTDSAEGIPANV
jgi:hypothetical protein